MENKENVVISVYEVDTLLTGVLIAICDVLTQEQREHVSTSLTTFGAQIAETRKDWRGSDLEAKFQSLALLARGKGLLPSP